MAASRLSPVGRFVLALFLAISGAAHAAVINVDIGQDVGITPYGGQGAAPDTGTVWNEITTSGSNLLTSVGAETEISVSLTGLFGFRDDGIGNALMQDYQVMWVFDSNYVGTLTISGLDADTAYLLYVYSAGNEEGQASVIELNGVQGVTSGVLPGAFVGDENDFVEGRNYVVMEVVADSSGQISGTYRPFSAATGLNGLQIVEIETPIPARVREISGADSPTVHSPGDTVGVEVAFTKPVTLSESGDLRLELDFEGTTVQADHVGATTGDTLRFEAIAPPGVTTFATRVLANSLQLLDGATLTSAGAVAAAIGHDEVPLANDQVSALGLSVYDDDIPDPTTGAPLEPSPYYSIRVRELGGAWQTPFAWVTQSRDDDDLGAQATDGSYKDDVGGWSHTYVNFEMANHVDIEVEITRLTPTGPNAGTQLDIERAVPHPRDRVKSWSVEDGRVRIVMDEPALLAVDIDGQFDDQPSQLGQVNENALHAVSVFANPFILDKPDPAGPGVRTVAPGERPPYDGSWTTLYFEKGVHQLFDEPWVDGDDFDLESGRTYYIPGDAIVHGNMTNISNDPEGGRDIRIFGHGTLSGQKIPHHKELGIVNEDNSYHTNKPIYVAGNAKGSRVEGVTVTDSANHSVGLLGNWNVEPEDWNAVRWTKVFTWRANGDGISPNGSGVLEDSFLRTQDDGTYVRGLGIRRMVYWSDVNGQALRLSNMLIDNPAPYRVFGELFVEDIDVLYARERFAGVGDPGRSVIGFDTLVPPSFDSIDNDGSHVVFRNVTVHDEFPTRTLFGLDMRPGLSPPSMAGVRFENVRAAARNVDGEKDAFFGTPGATMTGFVFDDVTLAGEHYRQLSDFDTSAEVSDFVFDGFLPQTMTYLNTSGGGKWILRDDWDSGLEPANNDTVNHTAIGGELIVDAPVHAGILNVGHPSTAVVSIENGGELAVSEQVSIGASGPGEIRLIDGTLALLDSAPGALTVSGAALHFEKGLLEWTGDHIDDIQDLFDAGAITGANGRTTSPVSGATLIGQTGEAWIWASFDAPTPGATTVWARLIPGTRCAAGVGPGLLALGLLVYHRRRHGRPQADA